eukprot:CAMPEP_0118720696 /NCGR_PEP_ID=MMETSP0800-20121206/30258_1 /TAXON_ID=210618 ORGANISM="Striatella unipunctata, Strain CCMP2910" /NCGR_SAMPLE_ID=MMETSP0800 /ASSEMBLY_ACC=CAM_ASM_000638 /LENGTH=296 /DNA_ID=CAMNT_0006628373 /DNA_START=219 /DNA_END=1109 /DNA_ORIENTATION=+
MNENLEDENGALFGTPEFNERSARARRERIRESSVHSSSAGSLDDGHGGQTMKTMKAVLKTVHSSLNQDTTSESGKTSVVSMSSSIMSSSQTKSESRFMTFHSTPTTDRQIGSASSHMKENKPSFALRVLVQERMAEIIATDIAGFQSNVEIKENTLSVTIGTLKATADKWMIPRRARKAFRAVAFEALYFVGEHGLITRGADPLYDLTPFEFHGLFAPLLAAMGDTMGVWLDSTNVLAEADLRKNPSKPSLFREKNEERKLTTSREKLGGRISAAEAPPPITPRRVPGNAFCTRR